MQKSLLTFFFKEKLYNISAILIFFVYLLGDDFIYLAVCLRGVQARLHATYREGDAYTMLDFLNALISCRKRRIIASVHYTFLAYFQYPFLCSPVFSIL